MSQTIAQLQKQIHEVKEDRAKALRLDNNFFTLTKEEQTGIITQISQMEQLKLDLSYMGLTELPGWLGQLTNLTSLNLSNNNLVELPEWLGQLTNLTSLNLRNNRLTELPQWLGQSTNLTWLDLSYTNLVELPEWLGQLTNLTSLNLGNNRLTELPQCLAQLTRLTSLGLWNTGLTKLPQWLGQLTNLTSLNLGNNYLTELPQWLGQLTRLTLLDLSWNNLTELPQWLGQSTNLTWLDLSYTNLVELPEWLGQLTNLTSLNLGHNRLTELPQWLSQLTRLTSLGLWSTGLTELPQWLGQLTNLASLNLGDNSLRELPEWLGQLTNLTSLNLRNNRIKRISSGVLSENLIALGLSGNPLEEPPLAVVEQGIEAIRNYFRQADEQGSVPIYEAKLLIVGEPGAGKTSLAKKLQNPDYVLKKETDQKPEKSTEGIEVIQWHFPFESGKPFRVNIWDFGGQEIYHATHQFFLTTSSLYFLVVDDRKEDTDFNYWLSVVELFSDNSPLLIIKNEKQDRKRAINESQLRGRFTNLEKTLATNLDTNRGLDDIEAALKYYVSRLPHVRKLLPKSWVNVRKAIEKDPRNYISLDEYLEICRQNGFTRRDDKLQLSRYLHILGICLHFQEDPILNRIVVLKPRWGTDAVYRVLDNAQVIEQAGRFDEKDLARIWNDPQYENMQNELLRLMVNFKLCYQVPSTKRYIAPQLLPLEPPVYEWDETDNLILRYTYEFMPKGIITQFIVAMHPLIAGQHLVWRGGGVLEKDATRAEVIETYGKREIRIRVAGKDKKELLTIVAYELDKIHDSYERLRYDKLIPCNCHQCKDSQEPYSYKFKTLKKFQQEGSDAIQCYESNAMVSVAALIDDVIDKRRLPEYEEKLARVYGELGEKALSARQVNIKTAIFQSAEQATFVNPQTDQGDIIMPREKQPKIKSAWANGSFYLFAFAIVIAALGVLARSVPFYVLPILLIAGALFVPLIGILQLRQDDHLKDKSFTELMKILIKQLPLLGKFAKTNQNHQLEE